MTTSGLPYKILAPRVAHNRPALLGGVSFMVLGLGLVMPAQPVMAAVTSAGGANTSAVDHHIQAIEILINCVNQRGVRRHIGAVMLVKAHPRAKRLAGACDRQRLLIQQIIGQGEIVLLARQFQRYGFTNAAPRARDQSN